MSFGNLAGQVRFTDITESSGIRRQGQSWGMSVFDFNQDGLPDIYQNNHQQKPVSLFLNQGDNVFLDVTAQSLPSRFPGDFHGAVGFDYDNDGDLDIFQSGGGDLRASDDNPNKSNRFLVQDNGRFIELAAELGIDFPLGRARMPAVFDFNDDGKLDVLYTGPRRPDELAFATIFLQEEGTFRNLGRDTGLAIRTTNGTYGIFADLTGDSRQELIYIAENPTIQVYDTSELPLREISDGLFEEGALNEVNVPQDIAVADFNGDAYQDLLIIQQGTGNSGFRLDSPNKGRAHLEPKGEALGLTFKNAGKLFLNFAGDPDLDLPPFIRSEIAVKTKDIFIGSGKRNPTSLDFRLNPDKASSQGIPDFRPGVDFGAFIGFDMAKQQWEIHVSSRGGVNSNFLFETERATPEITPEGFTLNLNGKPDILLTYDPELGQFVNSTAQSGLDLVDIASRNVVAEDFDNDGDRDIFIVATANTQNLPDVLYENLGDATFRRVPNAAGAAGILKGVGDTAVVGDFNVDGFVDIAVNNGDALGPDRNFWTDGTNRLFQNEGNENNWLQIDLEGTVSNRDAVGSKVYITTPDGKRQIREHNAGVHNRGQNFSRLHFGIGEQTIISEVEVIWPTGESQTFNNIAPNQVILLRENSLRITTLFGNPTTPQPIIGSGADDNLAGTANAELIQGLGGDDRLRGLNGNDTLFGGFGNDMLVGGMGEDVLDGGPGGDRFIYTSPNQGGDRILGFANDLDDIYISRSGFGGVLSLGNLPTSRFVLGNRAQDSGDRFIYNRDLGQLFFDADGNGNQNPRLLATFEGSPMLRADHIVVF